MQKQSVGFFLKLLVWSFKGDGSKCFPFFWEMMLLCQNCLPAFFHMSTWVVLFLSVKSFKSWGSEPFFAPHSHQFHRGSLVLSSGHRTQTVVPGFGSGSAFSRWYCLPWLVEGQSIISYISCVQLTKCGFVCSPVCICYSFE